MNGQSLLHVFDTVYLVSVGTWLGSALFVLFGIAPLLRAQQGIDPASIERAVWGRVSVWGAVCGAVALPSLVCGALGMPELRGPRTGIQAGVLLGALLAVLFAGNVLARRLVTGDEQRELAARRIVTCYSVVAVLLVLLLAAHAYRPAPATTGIVEPAPATRYYEIQSRMREANKAMWNDYWEQQKKARETGTPEAGAPASR
jgi:putative copper export protein